MIVDVNTAFGWGCNRHADQSEFEVAAEALLTSSFNLFGPLAFRKDLRPLQLDHGLIRRHAKQERFDFGRKIGTGRRRHDHSGISIRSQPNVNDRDRALAEGMGHYIGRGRLMDREPQLNHFAELLCWRGRLYISGESDGLDCGLLWLKVHPSKCEVQ